MEGSITTVGIPSHCGRGGIGLNNAQVGSGLAVEIADKFISTHIYNRVDNTVVARQVHRQICGKTVVAGIDTVGSVL